VALPQCTVNGRTRNRLNDNLLSMLSVAVCRRRACRFAWGPAGEFECASIAPSQTACDPDGARQRFARLGEPASAAAIAMTLQGPDNGFQNDDGTAEAIGRSSRVERTGAARARSRLSVPGLSGTAACG
jgi:hypothetical protein